MNMAHSRINSLLIFYLNFLLLIHLKTTTPPTPRVLPVSLEQICAKKNPSCHCNRMAKSDIQGNSRPELCHCPLDHPEECEPSSEASVLPCGAGAMADIVSWGYNYCGLTHQPQNLTGKLPSAQGLSRTAEEIRVVPVPCDTPACPKTQELRLSPSSLEIPVDLEDKNEDKYNETLKRESYIQGEGVQEHESTNASHNCQFCFLLNSQQLELLVLKHSCVKNYTSFTVESLCMRNDSRCLSNSCQKNSTCVADHKDDPCLCADASVDSVEELCNKTSNPCSSNPCLQNATCLGSAGNLSFTCKCPAGYNGPTCERAASGCETNPCEHGGTCQSSLAGPTCLCSAGYTGALCERDLDECISEPCRNGALCRDGVDEYSCYCVPGYQGKHCDLEVNECASDPCLNGAMCLNQIGHYDCIFPNQHSLPCVQASPGTNCEVEIDECSSQPCLNGGTCHDSLGSFSCSCPRGFLGDLCATDMDECSSQPCLHGGHCTDGAGGYVCQPGPGAPSAALCPWEHSGSLPGRVAKSYTSLLGPALIQFLLENN
ncbi:hypothetical protein Nmel_011040 [Mimus melanotis]